MDHANQEWLSSWGIDTYIYIYIIIYIYIYIALEPHPTFFVPQEDMRKSGPSARGFAGFA